MPKGGKLDRCHDHVKESLEKKGVDPDVANGAAWGICKKIVKPEKDDTDKDNQKDKKQ